MLFMHLLTLKRAWQKQCMRGGFCPVLSEGLTLGCMAYVVGQDMVTILG